MTAPEISAAAAGTRTLGDLTVNRIGFGAKRLTGRTALDLGMGHLFVEPRRHLLPRYPGTPREYWRTRVDECPLSPLRRTAPTLPVSTRQAPPRCGSR